MALLNIFEYNQHFVAMMNIINAARLNPPVKGHKHHIIPKCWFKMNNLPVDNSKENLVLLTEEQHLKVHKLSVLCIIGSAMKSAMGFAVHRLTHGSYSGMHHTEETRRKLSEINKGKPSPWKGKHHSIETRQKMSEAKKGKSSWNKGLRNIYSEETRRKMSEAHLNMSDETKRKMSEAAKKREARKRKLHESNGGTVNGCDF